MEESAKSAAAVSVDSAAVPVDSDARPRRKAGPTLWAVASGKGGVGKSVISSSLTIGLAATGPRAVAVDLDLGGANLHTLFGRERPRHNLSSVLRGRVASFEEALSDTTLTGVRLLSGAQSGLDAANPSHAVKQKILRGLRRIDAGHVVIDLGAGSNFNTLDAFLAADRRILVITPEATAIDNAYHFLKAAFFRSLRPVVSDPAVKEALREVFIEARRAGSTPRELVEAAFRVDPALGERLRAQGKAFEVDLVVNRSEPRTGRERGIEMAAACRDQLGANLRLAGSLPHDALVPVAVERRMPVMQLFPSSSFATEMRQLIAGLVHDEPIPTQLEAEAPRRAERARVEATEVAPAPPVMPVFQGVAPGQHLRACRELRGWPLQQLHERTCIRHSHLENLEAERYELLPPEFYLRAYTRQIAAALELSDGDAIADCVVALARKKTPAERASRHAAASPAPVQPAPVSPAPAAASSTPFPNAAELHAVFDYEPEPAAFEAPQIAATETRPTPTRPAPTPTPPPTPPMAPMAAPTPDAAPRSDGSTVYVMSGRSVERLGGGRVDVCAQTAPATACLSPAPAERPGRWRRPRLLQRRR